MEFGISNDADKVMDRACHKATKSWEIGAATESLLELYNPEVSVFGLDPFPNNELPRVDASGVRGLAFVKNFILTKGDILVDGNGTFFSKLFMRPCT